MHRAAIRFASIARTMSTKGTKSLSPEVASLVSLFQSTGLSEQMALKYAKDRKVAPAYKQLVERERLDERKLDAKAALLTVNVAESTLPDDKRSEVVKAIVDGRLKSGEQVSGASCSRVHQLALDLDQRLSPFSARTPTMRRHSVRQLVWVRSFPPPLSLPRSPLSQASPSPTRTSLQSLRPTSPITRRPQQSHGPTTRSSSSRSSRSTRSDGPTKLDSSQTSMSPFSSVSVPSLIQRQEARCVSLIGRRWCD